MDFLDIIQVLELGEVRLEISSRIRLDVFAEDRKGFG